MDDNIKKAIYANLRLLSQADGRIEASETVYLNKVMGALGVTTAHEPAFEEAFRSAGGSFLPIDASQAEAALTIIARMVRVDGEFSPKEQEAYLAVGKALGFPADTLGPILRKVWNSDPDDLLSSYKAQTVAPPAPILVIADELGDPDALKRSAPNENLTFAPMSEIYKACCSPSIVLFHAAEDRAVSSERLTSLQKLFPDALVGFIARRDQAPQIGMLLGLGAKRCFVEPLYPNEIGKAVREILRS